MFIMISICSYNFCLVITFFMCKEAAYIIMTCQIAKIVGFIHINILIAIFFVFLLDFAKELKLI